MTEPSAGAEIQPSQIYFEIHGDQRHEPLVLVHGIDDSRTFSNIIDYLTHDYRVILFDQRGHGRTPAIGNDYSLRAMSRDLHGLLEYLHLDRVHLLGHSAGGKTAMKFAELYPEKLKSLIIEDIGVRGGDLGPRDEYVKHIPAAYRAEKLYEYEALSENLTGALQSLKVPALFIFAGSRGVATIKAINPTVKIESIEGASHSIHHSHPKAFVSSIQRFTRAL